jgi:hypothetical protein
LKQLAPLIRSVLARDLADNRGFLGAGSAGGVDRRSSIVDPSDERTEGRFATIWILAKEELKC